MRNAMLAMGVQHWVLPALLVWPVFAAGVVRLLGRDVSREDSGAEAPSGGPDARWLTLGALIVEAIFGLLLFALFAPSKKGCRARCYVPWLADLGAAVSLGVDGRGAEEGWVGKECRCRWAPEH